jgi:NADP-dependent 3-hydroxy acid dehydrogenase YdfG
MQAAIASAEQALGPVDVLVANAGSAQPGHFHDLGLDAFESAMRTNYLGCVATIKAAYPGMIRRNRGHVCIVSSAMGVMGG